MEDESNWLSAMQTSLKQRQTIIDGHDAASDDEANNGTRHKELAVPIKLADQMLGVFGFAADEQVEWDEEEITAVEAIVEQVGLALENQRLTDQTQKALAETEALYAGSARVAQANTIDQVLTALVDSTALHLMEEVNLLFFDRAWENDPPSILSVAATWSPFTGTPRFPVEEEIAYADFPLLRDLQPDNYAYFPDIQHADVALPADVQRLKALGIHSIAIFPLVAGRQWFGLLTAFSAGSFHFNEDELRQISTLTDQASNVVQNLRLFALSETRAEELATLNEMARELASELSVDQIVTIIYRYLRRLIDAAEAYVAMYDDQVDEIDVRILGKEEEIIESALVRRGGKGITEYIIHSQHPLLLPVVTETTPQEIGFQVIGRLARSWAGVPMLIGNRCLGVIAVQDFQQPYRFNEHDQDILTAVAGQAAISLQNANLFDQTQQALAETQTLYDISARLNSALSMQDILEAAINPAVAQGAHSAGLWLMDSNGSNRPGGQELAAAWGDLDRNRLGDSTRKGRNDVALAWVWGSGEDAIFIEDVTTSELVGEETLAIFNALGTQASCSLPLVTGTRQVGAITLSWSEPREFSDNEKRMYRNIAAQTAEVVEGRLLLKAVQERALQLETLSRIEANLSQATDEVALLQAIFSQFEEIPQVELRFVDVGADNQPHATTIVAEWAEKSGRPVSGRRISLSTDLLAPLWLSYPHEVRAIPDVRQDVTLDDERRDYLLVHNIQSIAFLPFFSGGRWHGVITLTWPTPFTLSSIHQFVFRRLLEPVAANLASRRAQLAQQEALNETASLYRAITALNAARSYQEILEVINQYSTLGQEADILVYHQFDQPWTKEQIPEWFRIPARLTRLEVLPLLPRYRFADSPSAKYLHPDRPVWVENIDEDSRLDPVTRANLSGPIKMKSVIFVPLVYAGDWTGNMVAFYDRPRHFPADAVRRFSGLCTQAAIAIQNIRLVEEAEQRAHREQVLREITGRVRSATDTTTIVEIATQELSTVLGRQVYISLESAAIQSNGSSPIQTRPLSDHTYTEKLHIRQESIGQIMVADDPDDPLTSVEHTFIQAVAQQTAEALEYAWLLEQTRKRAVELETVSRVGTATSTILESERLLQSVVELTKQSFDLYHVQIYLLDSDKDQLMLVAGSGEVGAVMKSQNWRVNLDRDGLLTRVANTRKGIVVSDIRQELYYKPNPLLLATRAELAVPMMAGNRLLGVFDVHSDRPGTFTVTDLTIQNALATQVAVALQNAVLYEEQFQTAEKLREVERLKSEFLASMSHELRTPLNSIIGFADVLLQGIDGELNPRMTEDVELIRDSGQYLRELIGDILDMSKIEAGKMKLRYELIDASDLMEEIMANARTLAVGYHKEQLEISAEIKPEVTSVYADRTRIKQVMYNLLSNALKFTEEGQIRLSMCYEGEWFLVGVADTGIGIRPEDMGLIFEQFRQVDNTLTGTSGTGLGLPISKRLIELHGGKLWAESNINQGSIFWFKIPRYGAGYRAAEMSN